MFSAILSIDSQKIIGYQKLNSSNTQSVLYERVLEALSAEPRCQQQQLEQQRSQTISSPSSPISSLFGFAKRLFQSDDGASTSAPADAAADDDDASVSGNVGSLFNTTLLRALRGRGSNTLLCIVQGSVVFATTDAIVNAANQGCLGGGGVDGAICDAGGPALAAARRALPLLDAPHGRGHIRCHTGDAVATIGGDLSARICIHAVGPNYAFHRDDGDALLSSAYESHP